MRSFIPILGLEPPSGSDLHAKFGGLPWGLPVERWPRCRQCDRPMSLFAQIPVRGHLDRVAWLSGPRFASTVLHIFSCERSSICPFYELSEGANAAFFVSESELVASAQTMPSPWPPPCPEVWIRGWAEHDDLVPADLADQFTDETRFYDLPEDLQFPHEFETTLSTKVGGVPYWSGNGPGRIPGSPYRFLLQIDRYLPVPDSHEGRIVLGNFCSDGTGFLFVDPDSGDLASLFAINR